MTENPEKPESLAIMDYFRMKNQNKPPSQENCCRYFVVVFILIWFVFDNFLRIYQNFAVKEAVKDNLEQERRIYKE